MILILGEEVAQRSDDLSQSIVHLWDKYRYGILTGASANDIAHLFERYLSNDNRDLYNLHQYQHPPRESTLK